jgi:hypothetical protein
VSTGKYTSSRDEEELVDYEPEEPVSFSPVENELSVEEFDTPEHGDGLASSIVVDTEIPVHLAEGSNVVAGRKRRQMFLVRGRQAAPPTPTPNFKSRRI